MSGLVKGAKKIFRKVGKVIKKVAPIALAAGAIFFTAGAALGAAPAWSTAVSSMTSGLSGTLGSVVTGAVTQAGQAAAIGGLVSEATGGDFKDGATAGALTGGVLGGLGGYMNAPAAGPVTDGAGGQFANSSPALNQPQSVASMASNANPMNAGNSSLMSASDVAAQAANTPNQGVLAGLGRAQNIGDSVKSVASGVGNFIENNPTMTGMVVQGLGQGLSAQAQADELRKAEERKQRRLEESYRDLDYSGYRQFASPSQQGQEQPARQTSRYNYEYAYNPQTARIERRQRA